ncbi:MAG: peptide/nickel transport system substrate-binding protein [Gammaproteobacteria bacterium]|jgi:peptide/nickel transport system substrate-binding protein
MKKFESLQRSISEGRMGRREFIKHATALGMASAIPSLLLSEEAFASSPKRGGIFRQGLSEGSTSDTLFGVLGAGGSHQVNVQWQLLNNLTGINAAGQVVSELAESWEASSDATEWTFKLRKGVEFHNGKSFEAKDVVHSINVHRGPDTVSTGKGLVASVLDVRADGKHTVVFKLDSGNADFPYTLSDYHFPIAPDGSTPADWEKGIGTGPYILEEWEPGVQAITRRNPNYFKGGPNFDKVVTLNIPDVAARMNAIRTGEVDVIDKPDTKTLHLMERVPGIVISERSGNIHYTFPMLMDKAPFDNHNIRQAMKFAIDRDAMLDTILNGHGYVGNDHPIAKSQRFYAKDLPQRSYDPDKAKFHLKKAGLSKFDVTLAAGDIYAGGVDAATLFKEHAAKANININVDRVSTDGYWSNVWNTVPFCVSYWSGRPTEDLMLSLAFSNKSSWNETHWNNDRFEELLVSARAELDEIKRQDMYSEMQRLISDEGGLIAPVFANTIDVLSDKLGTPEEISSNMAVDGQRNTERWWFK